jgi:hypothetical protein
MNGCSGSSPVAYLVKASNITGGQFPQEFSDPYRNTNPYLKCRNIAPLPWGSKVSYETKQCHWQSESEYYIELGIMIEEDTRLVK